MAVTHQIIRRATGQASWWVHRPASRAAELAAGRPYNFELAYVANGYIHVRQSLGDDRPILRKVFSCRDFELRSFPPAAPNQLVNYAQTERYRA